MIRNSIMLLYTMATNNPRLQLDLEAPTHLFSAIALANVEPYRVEEGINALDARHNLIGRPPTRAAARVKTVILRRRLCAGPLTPSSGHTCKSMISSHRQPPYLRKHSTGYPVEPSPIRDRLFSELFRANCSILSVPTWSF